MTSSYSYEGSHLAVTLRSLESSSNSVDDKSAIRATFFVRVSPEEIAQTKGYPEIAGYLLEKLPGLNSHNCESGKPRSMATELKDTELAHLIEHVTLEYIVLAGAPRLLCCGETGWNHAVDGSGVYRVRISAPVPIDVIVKSLEATLRLVECYLTEQGL